MAAARAKEDEDPLSQTFDFVVLGTGLQECMFSAAAARAGASVLHLDEFDYYGGESASFTLNQLPQIAAQHDFAKLQSKHEESTELHASGPALEQQWPIRFHGDIVPIPEEMRAAARRVTVDLLPGLTLCRGHLIDALVDSGVASYLEFVLHHACYCVYPSAAAASSPEPRWQVQKLPCSKSDVFEESSIGLGQKRSLMKFLQFAQDMLLSGELENETAVPASCPAVDADGDSFGCQSKLLEEREADEGDESAKGSATGDDASPSAGSGADGSNTSSSEALRSLNERVLGVGRSLLRPQNKKTSPSLPFEEYRSRPFGDFLSSPAVGLPSHLQTMMMHAVALIRGPQTPSSTAVETYSGMRRLTRYLNAMGRYGSGNTAFVMPRFGHGELPQAFSRACAVHGGIYMLRTPIRQVTKTIAADGEGEETGSYYKLQTAPDEDSSSSSPSSFGLTLKARQVVSTSAYLPRQAYRASKPARFTLGAAVALVSPPLSPQDFATTLGVKQAPDASADSPNAEERKHLFTFVIPPMLPGLDNPRSVYVLQQGHGNASTPDNSHAVVNAWTEVETLDDGDEARVRAVGVIERLFGLVFPAPDVVEEEGAAADSTRAGSGRLLYRQFFSYQGRDAASVPTTEHDSLLSSWHALSGRSLDAGRLCSEFDALEAKRVFYAAMGKAAAASKTLRDKLLKAGKPLRFFGAAAASNDAAEAEEEAASKKAETCSAGSEVAEGAGAGAADASASSSADAPKEAPATPADAAVSEAKAAAVSVTAEPVPETKEADKDIDIDDALALLKGAGADDW